jgi:hypothetical protein
VARDCHETLHRLGCHVYRVDILDGQRFAGVVRATERSHAFRRAREVPERAALEAGFVRMLNSNSPDHIEIYRETMDLSRFGSDTYRMLLKNTFAINMRTKKSMW